MAAIYFCGNIMFRYNIIRCIHFEELPSPFGKVSRNLFLFVSSRLFSNNLRFSQFFAVTRWVTEQQLDWVAAGSLPDHSCFSNFCKSTLSFC